MCTNKDYLLTYLLTYLPTDAISDCLNVDRVHR